MQHILSVPAGRSPGKSSSPLYWLKREAQRPGRATSAWDAQPRNLVSVSPFLRCGGRDNLRVLVWGGGRGQERACKLKVCCRPPTLLPVADGGAISQLPFPSGGQTKSTVRDLEIPESVGCGLFPERKGKDGSQGLGEGWVALEKSGCALSQSSSDTGSLLHRPDTLLCSEASLTMVFFWWGLKTKGTANGFHRGYFGLATYSSLCVCDFWYSGIFWLHACFL